MRIIFKSSRVVDSITTETDDFRYLVSIDSQDIKQSRLSLMHRASNGAGEARGSAVCRFRRARGCTQYNTIQNSPAIGRTAIVTGVVTSA